jgi:GT2 family glycosyltransferase
MTVPPLVTIVTPSYNQGSFLRRTIESALRQTYPHIEYLVVDGGSTDESVSILCSYSSRFWWVSEPDRGQAHALNKGFARARGTICSYLNSDDVLLPRAVETVVAYLQQHPEWQMVYGRATLIDEQNRSVGTYRTLPFSLRRLAEDTCICQPAAFWRCSLAERIGPFDERLQYCMDYDYWLRMALAGSEIVHVDNLLACARIHPRAKTSTSLAAMYRESMTVCQRHLGRVSQGQRVGLRLLLRKERDASVVGGERCVVGALKPTEGIPSESKAPQKVWSAAMAAASAKRQAG